MSETVRHEPESGTGASEGTYFDLLAEELRLYPTHDELLLSIGGLHELYRPAPMRQKLAATAKLFADFHCRQEAEPDAAPYTAAFYGGSLLAMHVSVMNLPPDNARSVLYTYIDSRLVSSPISEEIAAIIEGSFVDMDSLLSALESNELITLAEAASSYVGEGNPKFGEFFMYGFLYGAEVCTREAEYAVERPAPQR